MKSANMPHCAFALIFAVLFVGSKPALATNIRPAKPVQKDIQALQLKTGEPFLAARARILKRGWTPERLHRSDNYEYSGTEKELAAGKYFEVDSCSMDAGALCLLHYRKANQCLRLETRGEQIHQMVVFFWDEKCAPPLQLN